MKKIKFWNWKKYLKIEFLEYCANLAPKFIKGIFLKKFGFEIYLILDYLVHFVNLIKLHTNLQFRFLMDLFGIDYWSKSSRFHLLYCFLSTFLNARLYLYVHLSKDNIIPSVSNIFASADWLEREVWDMYGIFFENHLDLRRIITDYGFEGFPLRKDFPLTGYNELRFSAEMSTIVYERLVIAQEFRYFDFLNPWDFRL